MYKETFFFFLFLNQSVELTEIHTKLAHPPTTLTDKMEVEISYL